MPKMMSPHELEVRWDGIIWLGDFNSRVEGYGMEGKDGQYSVLSACERGQYEHLVANDQLTHDLFIARNPILGAPCPFKEGHFEEFAPTFKVRPGMEQLPDTDPTQNVAKAINVYGTKRTPAYTDRILYFSVGMANDDSAFKSSTPSFRSKGPRGMSADGARRPANQAFSAFAGKRDGFLG
jgi:hypothetical protein